MTDFKLPDIGTGESTKPDEFRKIDVIDEFGKIHEHFFDDDGKVNSNGESVIFFLQNTNGFQIMMRKNYLYLLIKQLGLI